MRSTSVRASGASVAMLRALVWKEWREQRPVVLAGLALAVLIPPLVMAGTAASARPIDLATLAGVLPALYVAMLWPLLAAAAGAGAIANEIGDGTLAFLLSRPASRARLWSVKVAMAFLAGLLVLAGSLLVAVLIGLAAGQPAATVPGMMVEPAKTGITTPWPFLEIAGSGALLLFAASVFFSTFLSRAMTAAAGGVAASLLILSGHFLLWTGLELEPRLEAEWMALEVILTAGLVLLGSLFVFTRGELLRGGGSRRLALLAALAAIGGAGLVTVPLVEARGRLTPAVAQYHALTPSPAGDATLASVSGPEGRSAQIWVIHSDGGGMDRLTGRLTFGPVLSADGRWVAYFSRRGWLGLRSADMELRAVRVDGSEDHALAGMTAIPWNWMGFDARRIAFSPDGSMVAALDASHLVIVPLRGGPARTIDLAGMKMVMSSLAGWSEDGGEVLLLSRGGYRPGEGSTRLAAVDAASGRMRTVYQAPPKEFIWLPGDRPAGWRILPILVSGELLLVDVTTGGAETIAWSVTWWSPMLSDDGATLVYAVRPRVKDIAGQSEIHRLDLKTRADETLATVPGLAGEIRLSPGGDRLTLNRYDEGKPIPALTLSRDGRSKEWPDGWIALGWYGREKILFARAPGRDRLALGDAATGELKAIFP